MWHINYPSNETLAWYKDEYHDKIKEDIENDPDLDSEVKKILLRDNNLEQLLIAPPEKLYALNTKLESEINKINRGKEHLDKIYDIFNYDDRIKKAQAYELSKKIGTRTCVYCNRIYSFTVDNVSRPDFDHWLPKKQHPLLSMSFFNLIPCCPICNRSIKSTREFEYGKHIHPYCSKEETSFHFQYSPLPNDRWKLRLADLTKEEQKTAEILKTEDSYEPYANNEVKDLLDFVQKNPKEYINELKDIIMKGYGNCITPEQAYRIVLGTELNASLFLDRPLSKLKRDVLRQLQEDIGINLIVNPK